MAMVDRLDPDESRVVQQANAPVSPTHPYNEGTVTGSDRSSATTRPPPPARSPDHRRDSARSTRRQRPTLSKHRPMEAPACSAPPAWFSRRRLKLDDTSIFGRQNGQAMATARTRSSAPSTRTSVLCHLTLGFSDGAGDTTNGGAARMVGEE